MRFTTFRVPVLFALVILLMMSAMSFAQIGVSITFAPPELPVYDQPSCPDEGYIWIPGYWAWGDDDYYWVPGTWVMPPAVGLLWTPGYWGWGGNGFVFYDGYWGPEVGFYGGIDYGYGYFGHGYEGGRWEHDHFYYNRAVNNVNVTVIHNVYNTRVTNYNTSVARVSYNGGDGGVRDRATPQEEAAAHERHTAPPPAQLEHIQAARSNTQLRASVNQGKPPVAATSKPAAFNDSSVVPAKAGGHYSPPANRGGAPGTHPDKNASRPSNAVHPNDLPSVSRPPAPSTGNPKQDQKYQQQQEKLIEKQNQERQKLQEKQNQEHQRLEQQKADDGRKQQLEQRHQQQTQQLAKRQAQQQQRQQERQPPPRPESSKHPQ
jgi:hypothetical protein